MGKLIFLWHFIQTRWLLRFQSRTQLEAWQAKQLKRFLRKKLTQVDAFRHHNVDELQQLPLMDKKTLVTEFAAYNTHSIGFAEAYAVALQAETLRDFQPTLKGLTVGLSSGTSGSRGVFLVSAYERQQWAGILLAKTLPSFLLRHILAFWRKPLSIGFFLRANSNLYNTLKSRRIDFHFYDLTQNHDALWPRLIQQQPHVLVAPASVLAELARQKSADQLAIEPNTILSVAEVLDQPTAEKIAAAFALKPLQIYQATEGFLGYSCEHGGLHLNETHVIIEKVWLDATRFTPIITDFTRCTQLMVRYQLNDILVVADKPCPCGRAELHLDCIEGRDDDVLWLKNLDNEQWRPIYPDILRRQFALLDHNLDEYCVRQKGKIWLVDIQTQLDKKSVQTDIQQAIAQLCEQFEVQQPELVFGEWHAPKPGDKLRRWHCLAGPDQTAKQAQPLRETEGAV